MTEPDLRTADKESREDAFREHKMRDEQMVHRLRDWSPGQVVWGYEVVAGSSSTGKTYTRGGLGNSFRDEEYPDSENTGHDEARAAYEARVSSASPGVAAFLWVARIESVRSEPPTPDGEPPLKFARLTDVRVLESHFEPADGDADG